MDLGAYALMYSINTDKLLNDLNINIERLRGIRFMINEEKISKKNIEDIIKDQKTEAVETWLKQKSWTYSCSANDYKEHPAFIKGVNEFGRKTIIDYDFSKVHGKNRKILKFKFKQIEKAVKTQFNLFNKYVGKNVLYIHARQGGYNRQWCGTNKLAQHPLYLGDIDDYYDDTYCDIYFDISNINIEDYKDNSERCEN